MPKVRLAVTIVVSLAVTASLAACGGRPASKSDSSAPITLRLGSENVAGTPSLAAEQYFAQRVHDLTNGKVTISMYDTNQLGSAVAMFGQLQSGSLDMAALSAGNLTNLMPQANLFNLPYIIRSTDGAYKLFDSSTGTQILDSASSKGVEGLYYSDLGPYVVMSKSPVSEPADLKGVKFRTGADAISTAFATSIGANPVALSFPNVYPGLQQGIISAATASMSGLLGAKAYEVAPNLAQTNQQWVVEMTLMSSKTKARLSADFQKDIEQAAKDAQQKAHDASTASTATVLDKLKAAGAKVSTVDEPAFVAAGQRIYPQFESSIGSDLVTAATQLAGQG